MTKKVEDGLYQTKSFHSSRIWPEDRHVYVQGTCVRLVNYRSFGVTDEEHARHRRFGHDLFDYDFFFRVNILGPRIGDLPEGFNIRTSDNG